MKPDDAKLKPCPFCGDPMKQAFNAGVQHKLSGKKSASCILFHMGFQSPDAWNTRAPDLAAERRGMERAAVIADKIRRSKECASQASTMPRMRIGFDDQAGAVSEVIEAIRASMEAKS